MHGEEWVDGEIDEWIIESREKESVSEWERASESERERVKKRVRLKYIYIYIWMLRASNYVRVLNTFKVEQT